MLCELKTDTTTTVFVETSPQFMEHNKSFVNALLHLCRPKQTLRSGMINEHCVGFSFRSEMCELIATFFKPLFSDINPSIFSLGCSATMTNGLTKILSSLRLVGFPNKEKMWAEFSAFAIQIFQIACYHSFCSQLQ